MEVNGVRSSACNVGRRAAAALLLSLLVQVTSAQETPPRDVVAFLDQHCAKCHSGAKPKGDFALTRLDPRTLTATTASEWIETARMLIMGEMPPASRPRPAAAASAQVVAWLRAELKRVGADTHELKIQPTGNRLDHTRLFSDPLGAPLDNPPRLWRFSPQLYFGLLKASSGERNPLTQPMSSERVDGFFDMAAGRSIDVGTLSTLMRNAARMAASATVHHLEGDKVVMDRGGLGSFAALLDPQVVPERKALDAALNSLLVYRRTQLPGTEEYAALYALYLKTRRESTAAVAARAVLTAVFLQPESMFRLELGLGPADPQGRRRLSPAEIVFALGGALRDQPLDRPQLDRARKGALDTSEGVATEVRAMLAAPLISNPRILRFFQEYFAYTSAPDVFKDKALNPDFYAPALVGDTDQLIQVILMRDKDVVKELLTTRESFIGSRWDLVKNTGGPVYPKTNNFRTYNLDAWPEGMQPVQLPVDQRCGILTQPSWLVARSQNFNNDAIRRGKWIREHLLGQSILDVPITVCAKLPDDLSQTLRTRMEVTRQEYCWTCHQSMNPLGLAFEQYDHFGRYRTSETVEDPSKPPIPGRNPKLDPPIAAKHEVALDTTGALDFTSDPTIDGPVANVHELLHRLAASTRVRQVFVRHAFRYWMGRPENIGDATSLREADAAYVASGGSMKALIVALLSSDSFLYRTVSTSP